MEFLDAYAKHSLSTRHQVQPDHFDLTAILPTIEWAATKAVSPARVQIPHPMITPVAYSRKSQAGEGS